MKYIRFFWTTAIVLFVIPFLGIPQSVKDFIIIAVAIIIGFFAWVRTQSLKHKKEILKSIQQEQQEK